MRRPRFFVVAICLALCGAAPVLQQTETRFELRPADIPPGMRPVTLSDARYAGLTLSKLDERGEIDVACGDVVELEGVMVGKEPLPSVKLEEGEARLPVCHLSEPVKVTWRGETMPVADRHLSGLWALAPPLVAIVIAILFREVLVALLLGIWVGVVAVEGDLIQGTLRLMDRHLVGALSDADRLKILIFSCLLGAVVAMISRMGGILAIVEAVARRGQSSRRAQLSTWFLGLVVFFDDYANALLVGNTMRPITDRARISREKLAYLVDCTSAPVACVAPISTWIAAEIGYIDDWLSRHLQTHPDGVAGYTDPYLMFVDSIVYNFYPLLALSFAFMVVWFRRDLGPMKRAEIRAAKEGKLIRDGAIPLSSAEMDEVEPVDRDRIRWWNGVLPILTLVLTVVLGLYLDGIGKVENADQLGVLERLRQAYGSASSHNVLIWASFFGLLMAWGLALGQRLLTVRAATETTVKGIKAMMTACLVLLLAWTLSDLCKILNTSGFLIQQVSFSFSLLPTVVFLLAATVGFSTGSSWGTMAILVPLTLAFAWDLGVAEGATPDALRSVLLGSLGAVLAGAVFGDHCSPISDTTVMSSMAAGCDHVDHVRTQLPYALLVGTVAVLVGYLPAGQGFPPWASLLAGLAILLGALLLLDRQPAARGS